MQSYSHEELFAIALQCADALTWRQREKLLLQFGSAEEIFSQLDCVASIAGDKAAAELRAIKNRGAKRLLEQLDACGAQVVFRGKTGYPVLLNQIEDAPHALFLRGMPAEDSRSVAIVGSRRDTRYGRTQAYNIARDLAKAGVTVVSGLARGIDTAAHEGALAGGGRTVAVLGNGIDSVYPEENADLAQRIIASGGAIVTEFAFGAEPLSYHFPIRNRIISGISAALLLVEGHARSGTMITATAAADQGREVFALPGAVDAPGSAAPLRLLREGAGICTCAQDILEDMGWAQKEERSEAPPPTERLKGLSDVQRCIALLMLEEPRRFEEIQAETGIAPDVLTGELTMMELDGLIEPRAGRIYALKNE